MANVIVLALTILLSPALLSAQGHVDVKEWLGRPGVRLVAVEFYATWCRPCMQAMPRWKALQEKYGDQGLRVIAVSTQDPDAACAAIKGFRPDEHVCDLDGRIARHFGVGNELPSAFLWTWQGDLLVAQGHIHEVEGAVEQYLQGNPRVLVEGGAGTDAAVLSAVRSEITASGKLTVVANHEERVALARIKKAQSAMDFDGTQACDLGKDVPANSLLKATVHRSGENQFLNLALYDLETGCQLHSAQTRYSKNLRSMSRAAVVNLIGRLRRSRLKMPSGVELKNWSDNHSLKVTFESTPSHAIVEFNGEQICAGTQGACERVIAPGRYQVSMKAKGYEPRTETLYIQHEQTLQWRLKQQTGTLSITSNPSGLPVKIDGRPSGQTPIEGLQWPTGGYTVRVGSRETGSAQSTVTISSNRSQRVHLEPTLRSAYLTLEGIPAGMRVFLGERSLGTTPLSRLSVPPGGHVLRIKSPCIEEFSKVVHLRPGQNKKVAPSLRGRTGVVNIRAIGTAGQRLRPSVWVDGHRIGHAPGRFELNICTRKVELRHPGMKTWVRTVDVREGGRTQLRAELQRANRSRHSARTPMPKIKNRSRPVKERETGNLFFDHVGWFSDIDLGGHFCAVNGSATCDGVDGGLALNGRAGLQLGPLLLSAGIGLGSTSADNVKRHRTQFTGGIHLYMSGWGLMWEPSVEGGVFEVNSEFDGQMSQVTSRGGLLRLGLTTYLPISHDWNLGIGGLTGFETDTELCTSVEGTDKPQCTDFLGERAHFSQIFLRIRHVW